MPVISSVALGSDGQYYNVNADQMASACAVACHANALIFLTNVSGVKDADGLVIRWLDLGTAAELTQKSVIQGGMLPKLDACRNALLHGVNRVRILPAAEVETLPEFYFTKIESGTGGVGRVNLEQVKKLESKLLLATYDRYPVLLHKGRGVHLYDEKGRKYLDFLSGIGVNALGYAHPAITRTIVRQAKLMVHTSNLFYHEYQGKLAAALTKISGMDRAFFTNSGTEAWEGALKVARAYAKSHAPQGTEPKWRILALEHAFHGRTFGSLATTTRKNIARHSHRWCRVWNL